MGLPPRVFWTLDEAAARWGCMPSDIVAWSVAGRLDITTTAPPVTCGDRVVAGLVVIAAADVMRMFRRTCSAPRSCSIRRLRPEGEPDWLFITDPEDGITVEAADLVIMAREAARFEDEHELFRRPGGFGPEPRYDWEAFYQQVCIRLHEHGLPETQAEFVAEMQEWFVRRSETGDAPDERTIRRRLNPIWRALRKQE